MAAVDYCENSTISEAWAVVIGTPAVGNAADEVAALAYASRRKFPGIETRTSHVLADGPKEAPVPPHWTTQLVWEGGRHVARIGPGYLSVHFVRGAQAYEKYENSLGPEVAAWLEILTETFVGPDRPVGRVVFGYSNAFSFPAANFDASQYFKLNLGIGVGDPKKGLRELSASFRMPLDGDCEVSCALAIEPLPGDSMLFVRTKTIADDTAADLTFSDAEGVSKAIVRAKNRAKTTFFDFATEKTHDLMKAHYESA